MERFYSFIIPVFNRPHEIDELLASIKNLNFQKKFEVVIVEDGSSLTSENIVEKFKNELPISYYYKKNTGPGFSRNYGMKRAKGDFFIILDSDVILPPDYLQNVDDFLNNNKIDFFGGPDAAHHSFSKIQKAINYTMTAFLTTGGLRGKQSKDYEPRSFNMGISKAAFFASGGFGSIHPGEDPDLSLRLKKLNFTGAFIPNAVVFHKRRINFSKFYAQVKKFGLTRAILLKWHPSTFKISFFLPSFFIIGLFLGLLLCVLGSLYLISLYFLYFLILFIDASLKNKSILIGILAMIAVFIQFFGYGIAFMQSFFLILIFKKDPEKVYPNLFFKNV